MSEQIRTQILIYCEAVRTGIKPVAMMSIQSRYEKEIKKIVKQEGIKIHLEDVNSDDGWKVAWIYKHDYLVDVIKAAPEHPNSTFEHWVLGKLFGYSDEAIRDFVIKL